jgi:tetratricopeptide (TPR) repeat protein
MALGTNTGFAEAQTQFLTEVGASVAASDLRRACELANIAIGRRMHHPTFYNARAMWLQALGRHSQALEDFRRALWLAPGDAVILNVIGMCQLKLDQLPDAVNTFKSAVAAAPDSAQGHYRLGLAQAMIGNHDAAQACYERAIELDPDHPEAIASLASIAARKAEPARARLFAERALKLNPHQPTALVALVILDIAEKKYVEAEHKLRALLAGAALNPEARAPVLGLLGDALDGQKRYAEAFEAYVQENDELRRQHVHRFTDGRVTDAAHHLITYFDAEPASRWKASGGGSVPGGPDQHVFLLGFMRSGTTLLEQVLASNPKIVALEEQGLLHGMGATYLTSFQALDSLAALDGAALAQQRETYWRRVREAGVDVAGKVFVDKQPLNTVKLPLIAKLFPDAKILFALRDPRDVVFSCFRRHFKVNVTMFEFLALEDSARFYTAIMRLAEVYREKLPLNLFEHYYEDMVVDFETRVRAVCDFIGVEWTDSMRDFNRNAPVVDLRSPSATQVRRPLYGEGIGQWRNYVEQLAPILPMLQPWALKFGYPGE